MLVSFQTLNRANAVTYARLGIRAALPLCRVSRSPLRAMSSATDPAATEVAVVGAGISGLHCARTLSQYGYTVTVFDMGKSSVGEVSLAAVAAGPLNTITIRPATQGKTRAPQAIDPFSHTSIT
jgi:heterodisulfide reductase subunit A-like polyferredoxin